MLEKSDGCTKEYAYYLLRSIPSTPFLFCEGCIDALHFDVFGYEYPTLYDARQIRDGTAELIAWAYNKGKEVKRGDT